MGCFAGKGLRCLFVLIMSACLFNDVHANSAQSYWEGTDSTGQIMSEGDSPLQIEKEELTFEIHQFPQTRMDTADELEKYQDYVEAQYSIVNPGDYKVAARLFFPFGHLPSYIDIRDEQGNPQYYPDSQLRKVRVNGQEISYILRHSYSSHGKFDVETELSRLKDEIRDRSFFRCDLPVHYYAYSAAERLTDEDLLLSISVEPDIAGRIYHFKNQRSLSTDDERSVVEFYADSHDGLFHIAVLGDEIPDDTEMKVYPSSTQKKKPVETAVELAEHRTSTLKEELLKIRPQQLEISETDWINACFDYLESTVTDMPVLDASDGHVDIDHLLMRWIEYEITLDPKQSMINTVRAPVYPSVDENYEPPLYEYAYLLTPLSTWNFTGTVQVHLNTDFLMVDEQGWERCDEGYTKQYEEVPQEELVFRLSSSSCPEKKNPVSKLFDHLDRLYYALGLILVLTIFILLLVLCFLLYRRWASRQ